MALDEPTDKDDTRDEGKFKLAIDRQLLIDSGGVSVDYRALPWGGGRFVIQTVKELGSEGGSDCAGCSCGS